jgi:hypothetical protein
MGMYASGLLSFLLVPCHLAGVNLNLEKSRVGAALHTKPSPLVAANEAGVWTSSLLSRATHYSQHHPV